MDNNEIKMRSSCSSADLHDTMMKRDYARDKELVKDYAYYDGTLKKRGKQ